MRATSSERTLRVLIGLGVLNHSALTGTRVTVSLSALDQGTSAATVGMLLALYALLPMFAAVTIGRLSDRIGVRTLLLAGSVGIATGTAISVLAPGLPALFASAAIVGLSFTVVQIPTQNATGALGDATTRSTNFSLLALGYSTSGFLGPLVAGFAIDHAGFRPTFMLFTLLPLATVAILLRTRPAFPEPPPPHLRGPHAGVLRLLAHRGLRRVFAINVLLSMAWEVHTIFVPVYGQRIGLSASAIGSILAAFAAATFLVRLLMPKIARHLSEHQVLTLALFVAGLVYLALPFVRVAPVLMMMSFVLGIGLGSSQPMVMSLLHASAPPGRMGEVVGVRMSLVQACAVTVPLVFGALGASIGMGPVLWGVSACLAAGGWISRRVR